MCETPILFGDWSYKKAPDLAAMQIRYFGSFPREHARVPRLSVPMSAPHWWEEETDSPVCADNRAFYNVEQRTDDDLRVARMFTPAIDSKRR